MHGIPHSLPQPGLIWGVYPEKRLPVGGLRLGDRLAARLAQLARPGLRRYTAIAQHAEQIEHTLPAVGTPAYGDTVRALRRTVQQQGLNDEHIAHALALTGLACRQQLGLTPFHTQRMAAAIMLDNQLAEMATGEGKTLVAGLVAACGALAGMPVHVLTANPYLAQRDAAYVRPVFAALGFTVGVVHEQLQGAERQAAYACDITYGTAREVVFDYLRDLPARQRHGSDLSWHAARTGNTTADATILRGLCMAVIDEADSILIDEARTPFILSEQAPADDRAAHAGLLQRAASLRTGIDFVLDAAQSSAHLTETGRASLPDATEYPVAGQANARYLEASLCVALAALHLYQRDRDYLVQDDAIIIIDATTGRPAPGRIWARGLHRLIEIKEGCPPGVASATCAQITYQRFFPRYHRLCGMSGTLAESRREIARVYRLPVVVVPLHQPSRRRYTGHRVFRDAALQAQAAVVSARQALAAGRAVLIATESVAESDYLAEQLTQAGLHPTLLNARNDGAEAAIVALAGQPGRLTVSTNMAGRGTDIRLDPAVAACGGLHVINCQLNSSRRIDRQLEGRCARQGDPGSAETLLRLDQPLMTRNLPSGILRWVAHLIRPTSGQLATWPGRALASLAQRLETARQQSQRALLLEHDTRLDRQGLFRE